MGSEVTVPAVVKLIESSIEVWNMEVEQLQAGQAKLEGANPPDIAKVHVAASPNAIRKQAEHFLRKYDFQVARVSKPGKHLSTNDPQIIAVKEYVLEQVRNGTVHPAMVGNFDQVWTTLYEPAACRVEEPTPSWPHEGPAAGEWALLKAACPCPQAARGFGIGAGICAG